MVSEAEATEESRLREAGTPKAEKTPIVLSRWLLQKKESVRVGKVVYERRQTTEEGDAEASAEDNREEDDSCLGVKRRRTDPIDWEIRDETRWCLRRKRIGSLTILYDWNDGRIVVGPYWHFLLLTCGVIVFVGVGTYAFVVPRFLILLRSIGLVLTTLSLIFLLATGLTDPGIFPRYQVALDTNWTFSDYAQSWRPPGTIYCKHCKLLILDYHHFCPWIGTAIGHYNLTYFHSLIFSLCLSFTYDFLLIILVLKHWL